MAAVEQGRSIPNSGARNVALASGERGKAQVFIKRFLLGSAGMVFAAMAVFLTAKSHPGFGRLPAWADVPWFAVLAALFSAGCLAFFLALDRFDLRRALRKTGLALAAAGLLLVLIFAVGMLAALIGGLIESVFSRDSDGSDSDGDKSDNAHGGLHFGGWSVGSDGGGGSTSSSNRGTGRGHIGGGVNCPGCGRPSCGGMCAACSEPWR